MTAADAIELIQLFESNGIPVVIDGGWGVDALLGEQTRPHEDLDIAIQHSHAPELRKLLEGRGYREQLRDDTRDCNFVLADDFGRVVDIHTFEFDALGTLTFGVEYPFESLQGKGTILGREVRCITPEWSVRFHCGYELDENDYRDVSALCAKFGIELPDDFRSFVP